MATEASGQTSLGVDPARRRWLRAPRSLWLPVAIFAVSRLADALVISWASRFQSAIPAKRLQGPTDEYFAYTASPADPGYFGVATNWDGQWYHYLAVEGYQAGNADSAWHVIWGWAFPPGYPRTVSAFMQVTGWSFPVAAVTVSLVLAAIAMVLIYRLAEPRMGSMGAATVVAFVSFFPSAPLLQAAYSESAALFLVAWGLLHLDRRQYWWAVVPLMLLAMTRLITPPLALVALFAEWARRRNGDVELSVRQRLGLGVYVVAAVGGVMLWSFLAQSRTDGFGASRATAVASSYSGGWFGAAFGSAPARGIFLVLVSGFFFVVTIRQWRRWGAVLSGWAAFYPLFILLTTTPTTGFVRYLLLAFPLGLFAAQRVSRSKGGGRIPLAAMCLALFALQILWVRYSFILPVSGIRFLP